MTIESDGTSLSASVEKEGTVVAGDTDSGSESSDSTGAAATGAAAAGATNSQTDAGDGSDPTVYTTKTGGKYHREGCQYLRKSKIPISLSEAKAQGLEPCSKCHPPT